MRQIDGRHPADAKLVFDDVPVSEGSFEAVELVANAREKMRHGSGERELS